MALLAHDEGEEDNKEGNDEEDEDEDREEADEEDEECENKDVDEKDENKEADEEDEDKEADEEDEYADDIGPTDAATAKEAAEEEQDDGKESGGVQSGSDNIGSRAQRTRPRIQTRISCGVVCALEHAIHRSRAAAALVGEPAAAAPALVHVASAYRNSAACRSDDLMARIRPMGNRSRSFSLLVMASEGTRRRRRSICAPDSHSVSHTRTSARTASSTSLALCRVSALAVLREGWRSMMCSCSLFANRTAPMASRTGFANDTNSLLSDTSTW